MKRYHCVKCEFESETSHECFVHLLAEGHEEFLDFLDLSGSYYHPLEEYSSKET